MVKVGSYRKPVEIYLPSAVIRGTLVTKQERLTDHLNLRGEDQVLSLQDVQFEDLQGNAAPESGKNMIVYVHQVMFVVDLGIAPAMSVADAATLRVKRESREVCLGVGPFWLQGKVHLPPGAELGSFAQGKIHFIPLTEGTFLNCPTAEPRTFIINREKIDFLVA